MYPAGKTFQCKVPLEIYMYFLNINRRVTAKFPAKRNDTNHVSEHFSLCRRALYTMFFGKMHSPMQSQRYHSPACPEQAKKKNRRPAKTITRRGIAQPKPRARARNRSQKHPAPTQRAKKITRITQARSLEQKAGI